MRMIATIVIYILAMVCVAVSYLCIRTLREEQTRQATVQTEQATLLATCKEEYSSRVWPGKAAEITNDIGKPMAVLTIDYGERPRNFGEGEFYVLKCLKVRGTKIDYGFCPIEREGFYNTRKEKEQ